MVENVIGLFDENTYNQMARCSRMHVFDGKLVRALFAAQYLPQHRAEIAPRCTCTYLAFTHYAGRRMCVCVLYLFLLFCVDPSVRFHDRRALVRIMRNECCLCTHPMLAKNK